MRNVVRDEDYADSPEERTPFEREVVPRGENEVRQKLVDTKRGNNPVPHDFYCPNCGFPKPIVKKNRDVMQLADKREITSKCARCGFIAVVMSYRLFQKSFGSTGDGSISDVLGEVVDVAKTVKAIRKGF